MCVLVGCRRCKSSKGRPWTDEPRLPEDGGREGGETGEET